KLPFHMAGNRRKIYFKDLLEYKAQQKAVSKKTMARLAQLSQEMGLMEYMATFTVIYDANVLYPAPLRSVLMFLAQTDLFRARWTLDIHEEWIRNLLLKRPDLSRKKLEWLRDMMIEAVPDSLVTGYEPAIDGLEVPDPDDRHVLAAALRANAEIIGTANLKDFPQTT